MAFITADRVKDTSTTTGTGNITVSGSAPFGYRTFSTVLSVGDTFYYAIQGQATAEWEIGVGTYASTNQFARTTVLASSASGSAVSFSSGTKNVFITLAAARTLQLKSNDTPTAGSIPYGDGSTLSYSSVGTAGQVLLSGGSGSPTWSSAGTGSVTSVAVSGGTTGLTTSGGPVTSSGTITLAGTLAIANGGTNSTATPTAGTIPYGTGTAIAYSSVGTSGQVLTSGGSGAPTWTTVTGTGTVTSVNVSGGTTGLTYSGGPITASGTITMAGTLAAANGGTGLTSPGTSGNVLTSNGSAWVSQAPSGGSGTSISNGTSNVTIASSNGAITAATAGTTAMTIDTSQSVGIGSGSIFSGAKLDVAGSGTQRIYIRETSSSVYAKLVAGTTSVSFGSETNHPFVMYTNDVDRGRFDTNGYFLVGYTTSNGAYRLQVNSQIFATSSTIATSDARYKQNIETLNGALSIVQALRPVSFDWKKHPVHAFDTENTTVGFLAQEVQQVLADKPYLNSIIKKNECVIEPEIRDENGGVTTAAVTEEFLGIAEGNMIAILTSAIQELSATNDALEARLAALEAK